MRDFKVRLVVCAAGTVRHEIGVSDRVRISPGFWHHEIEGSRNSRRRQNASLFAAYIRRARSGWVDNFWALCNGVCALFAHRCRGATQTDR